MCWIGREKGEAIAPPLLRMIRRIVKRCASDQIGVKMPNALALATAWVRFLTPSLL